MKIMIVKKRHISLLLVLIIAVSVTVAGNLYFEGARFVSSQNIVKWVDFNIPYTALNSALSADVMSLDKPVKVNWIDVLSRIAVKNGGKWSEFTESDTQKAVRDINSGKKINSKNYQYYFDAYQGVLGGIVGYFEQDGKLKYGLKAFSPIAEGFDFSHYKDYGDSRNYGYNRPHLGHDLMGSIGTPIVSVESGTVEVMGWNTYGGWRIGIRSLDDKRYYYYAHLRKDRPYHTALKQGDYVTAGQVIGYLGMTGYSSKENVNNIDQPHLHYGMQLFFHPSQEGSSNEIWVDMYALTTLLQQHKSVVVKNEKTRDYDTKSLIVDPDAHD